MLDVFLKYRDEIFTLQDRVQQCEKFVSEHQEYSDSYNTCVEWLNSVREKLSSCSDVSGDRHAIQSRLDKIQVNSISSLLYGYTNLMCICIHALCLLHSGD